MLTLGVFDGAATFTLSSNPLLPIMRLSPPPIEVALARPGVEFGAKLLQFFRCHDRHPIALGKYRAGRGYTLLVQTRQRTTSNAATLSPIEGLAVQVFG